MKRSIVGCAAFLALSVLTFGVPSTGAGAASKVHIHTLTVRCTKAAQGHSKVTRADISACQVVKTTVAHHCATGRSISLVKVGGSHFALRQGHAPAKLNSHNTLQVVASMCGGSVTTPTSVTTTSTAPPQTTTTTRPPAPVTTTTRTPLTVPVTAPPTTVPVTAAPANCTPLTDGGNCYEPGEFCRADDHGVTGRAGDGETITCEDNNGWRWEPT
jgi:hypothetical protein